MVVHSCNVSTSSLRQENHELEGQPGADIKAGIQGTGGLLFMGVKK